MGYETSIASSSGGVDLREIELGPSDERPNSPEEKVEFGRDPRSISRSDINAFFHAQTRKTYDQESIAALAGSIDTDGLLHPITVAELSSVDAERYVLGLNQLRGSDYKPEEIAINDDGSCYILVAGHRRVLAMDHLIDESGNYSRLGADHVDINANVFSGLSLLDALRLQIAENSHEGLPIHEDAYSIRMFYEESGHSLAQCARELGRSEEKVRLAVRFSELPQAVRATVEDGLVPYSAAVALAPLARAYEVHRDHEGAKRYNEQEIEDLLMIELGRFRNNEWSAAQLKSHIQGLINDLGFDQMAFEMELEDGAISETAAKRRGMAHALGETALIRLRLAVEHLDSDALNSDRARNLIDEITETLGRYSKGEDGASDNQSAFELDY